MLKSCILQNFGLSCGRKNSIFNFYYTQFMKKITLLASLALMLGLVACNNDDDRDDSPPPPPVKMEATRINGTTGVETDWSISNPKATISFLTGATITGFDEESGEMMTISLPSFQEGFYSSIGPLTAGGISTYLRQTGGVQYTTGISVSGSQQEATHVIEITSIDTVKSTFNGTFTLLLFNPLGLPNDFYFFDQGIFENVPYEEEEFTFGDSSLSASIDGAPYTAEFVTVFNLGGSLSITSTAANSSISLSFPSNITPGTYGIGFSSANPDHVGSVGVNMTPLIATDGTLVITSNNAASGVATGTFEFEAADGSGGTPVNVTNGVFSIEY
jgi:hypothetical protein